jgi:hypothetical protein
MIVKDSIGSLGISEENKKLGGTLNRGKLLDERILLLR